MTDELGMRKNGRRRRTTRRLARRPIRVPGDDVPRQSLSTDLSEAESDDDTEVAFESEPASSDDASEDRRSADSIDVDLDAEVNATEPTSGVVHAPARSSMVAPAGDVSAAAASAFKKPSVPAPAGPASVAPPAPSFSELPDERRMPEAEIDVKTNPHIRIVEAARRASSKPPPTPVRSDVERDEPTRPRIELSHEMAMAAGRVTSLDLKVDLPEDTDVDTNPRIPIAIDEEPAQQSVIVTRSRVISDLPGPPSASMPPAISATFDSPSQELPRPMTRSKRPPSGEIEIDALDIAEGLESSLPPQPSMGAPSSRLTGEIRPSKTPPPPPDGPGRPILKRPPTGAIALPGAGQQGSIAQKAPPPPPPPSAAPKKPAQASKQQPRRRQWWEDFFSDDYLHSVRHLTAAQIIRQVDFIEASLALPKGSAILDVGCGLGSHALELARRGYLVVGLDLSLPMITRAAEAAQQEGLRINFLHTDIREIGFQGTFDGIVCVGTTFGFFDEDTNRDVLARFSAALKPNGKLLLDVVNRDHVVRSQPNLVWFEGDGCVVMEESDFNYFTSRLGVKRTMMREDGRQSDAEYSLRLYSLHELGQMLAQTGFRVSEVSGQEATRGMFFGGESARVILVAERRAPKGTSNPQTSEHEPGTSEMSKPSS